jgi:hypothetical protein
MTECVPDDELDLMVEVAFVAFLHLIVLTDAAVAGQR